MKLATWNVNGIRARQGELLAWLATERPDVVCLQEIKASLDQLPFDLSDVDGYWSFWHGEKGYSGVGLLVSREFAVAEPSLVHPAFDFEQRIATVDLLMASRPSPWRRCTCPTAGRTSTPSSASWTRSTGGRKRLRTGAGPCSCAAT